MPHILSAQNPPKSVTVVQSASSFQSITAEPLLVGDNAGGAFAVYRNRRASGGSVQLYAQRIHPWNAQTQWAKDGVAVCPLSSNQLQPVACLDGQDGLILAWQDDRQGINNQRIYVQRLSPSGELLWAHDGVWASSGTNDGPCRLPQIVSDGLGGAYLLWQTDNQANESQFHVQRIGSDGTLLWGNGTDAVALHHNFAMRRNAQLVESPEGGVVVVWEEFGADKIWRLRAQKLGVVGLPLWPVDGLSVQLENHAGQRSTVAMTDGYGGLICAYEEVDKTGDVDIWLARVAANGNLVYDKPVYQGVGVQEELTAVKKSGRVVLAWADERSGDRNIYLQWVEMASGLIEGPPDAWPVCLAEGRQYGLRFAPSPMFYEPVLVWVDERLPDSISLYGQVIEDEGAPFWQPNGLQLTPNQALTVFSELDSWAVGTDEHGGAWLVFLKPLNGGFNTPIYQHVQEDGTLFIPGEGLPLCASHTSGTIKLNNPVMAPGLDNDLYIVWEDYRNGQFNADVFLQRVKADGSVVFGQGGKPVCTSLGAQLSPTLCPAKGGVYVAWLTSTESFEDDVYLQFVDSTGKLRWAAGGLAVCTAERSQSGVRMTLLPDQSVRLFWTDGRTFDETGFDIYEQIVSPDGKPRFGENGRLYAGGDGYQTSMEVAVLENEVLGLYMDDRVGYYNLNIRRDKAADQQAAWGPKPLVKMNVHQRFPSVQAGEGHVYISWVDDRFGFNNSKAYVQKINGFGSPVWALSGIQATIEAGKHTHPVILPDGAGGAYLGWLISYDYDKSKYALYAQQFDANGFVRWETKGKLLTIGLGEHQPFSLQRVPGGVAYCWLQPASGTDPEQVLYLELTAGDGNIKRNEKFGQPGHNLDKASFCTFANGKRAVSYIEIEPQNSTYILKLRLF